MGLFAETQKKEGFDVKPQAWLDRLMRTNYASANLAKSIFSGELEPLEAIKRGLTGKDKTLYSDVLTTLGWEATSPEEKAVKGLAGLGLDIAADPLTYIPVGGLIAKGGKKLGKIPQIAKATTAIREARITQTLGKTFISHFRPVGVEPEIWSRFIDIEKEAKNIQRLGTEEAFKFSTDVLGDIKKLQASGNITNETLGNLLQSVERRSFASGLPETVKPLWQKLTSYADDIARKRKTIGKSLLNDEDYSYWLHTLSEAEKENLRKTGLDVGLREFTTKTASDISRKYKRFVNPITNESYIGKTAQEGFTATRQATIKEINETLGREFFSTDLPFTSYVMGKRLARQRAGTAFFEYTKTLGSPNEIEGWVKSTAPELQGLYFNPQIAKEIDKIRQVFIGEETSKEFLKLFDSIQNYWKLQTLGIFPSYHFRNFIGNVWNNFLGGVVKPDIYGEAYGILNKVYKGIPLEKSEKSLYVLARESGVLGRGIMGAEIPRIAPETISSIIQKTRRPAEAGMRLGEKYVEDPARLAHFIDKIKKGWTPSEASLSVKKYLFDYRDLTPFEENVLRRFMPFYTWSRKNIPLQIEALIKQPAKPLGFEKLRQEMTKVSGVTEEEKEFLPEWVKRRMPFFVPTKGKEKRYFPVESWLPLGDIMKLGRPADIFGELLTPILKAPIEMSQNRLYYFDRPIEEYKGQTKEMLGRDIPAYLEYLLRQIRLLNEFDKLSGVSKTPERLLPKPLERIIRTTTGIKLDRYELERAKRSKAWEIKNELQKLSNGLSRAEKYGRREEMGRISQQIEEMKEELERSK